MKLLLNPEAFGLGSMIDGDEFLTSLLKHYSVCISFRVWAKLLFLTRPMEGLEDEVVCRPKSKLNCSLANGFHGSL